MSYKQRPKTRFVKLSLLSWTFLLLVLHVSFDSARSQGVDSNPYRHTEVLDPRGRYNLEWLVDWEREQIIFNVTAATRGYVAFGLSQRPTMTGADIIIGGVNANGRPYFTDRHAVGNQEPVLDANQDWVLLSARENSSHTFLQFSRPFDTCDDQDVPISDDTLAILWAFGETDDTAEYHYRNRGTKFVYLRDPDLTPRRILEAHRNNQTISRFGSNVSVWTIREIFNIPSKRTTYWCNIKKFAAPKPGKHQIIGVWI